MPATVVPEVDVEVDDDLAPGFLVLDRMPASAIVAGRVLGTCRAAGCASPADRRARSNPVRKAGQARRSSR